MNIWMWDAEHSAANTGESLFWNFGVTLEPGEKSFMKKKFYVYIFLILKGMQQIYL